MNRKTLVLPAVVGLLAPVLAACGGSDSGGGSGDAIVVGTTDRFTAIEGRPGAARPGLRLRRRHLEHPAPDRADPDGPARAATASRCPRPPRAAASPTAATSATPAPCASGLKFANGDAVTAEDVKFSIDRALRHQGRQRRRSPCCPPSTPSRPRATTRSSSTSRPPTRPSRSSCRPRSPASSTPTTTTKDKLRDGFEVDGSGPYTLKAEVKDDELVKAVFTKNPNYKGDVDAEERQGRAALLRGRRRHGHGARQGRHRPDDPHHVARADQEALRRLRRTTSTSSRCPAWRSATSPSTPTPRR